LLKHLREQIKATLRGAYRLEPAESKARLEQQGRWLDKVYPSAAASLRKALDETFTVNAIGLPGALRRWLVTTNLIESPQSKVRMRTRRVTRRRNGAMALRWAASAMLATEKKFRRIMGYKQLWILKAYLDEGEITPTVDVSNKKAG